MPDDINSYLPLNPATLHILLALVEGDLHGYGIMREVARQSLGHYKIGPGTLYDNLQKLLDDGLVIETERAAEGDSRRRYYRLSTFGKKVLASDLERLETAVKEAKARLRLPKPRKA
jgi:DNA-binding PadR family transcriptional regulator